MGGYTSFLVGKFTGPGGGLEGLFPMDLAKRVGGMGNFMAGRGSQIYRKCVATIVFWDFLKVVQP